MASRGRAVDARYNPFMESPNILFLMTDQMQARVLEPGHACRTPNFDRLMARGVRFRRAYTPNPICSPARASLMTGRLPHNHGVLSITHGLPPGMGEMDPADPVMPHWAQRLNAAGYRTGYFGKWHVERSDSPGRFGWQTCLDRGDPAFRERLKQVAGDTPVRGVRQCYLDQPEGYKPAMLYGVITAEAEQRHLGVTCDFAGAFIEQAATDDAPWCCFVSVLEPHDPFICAESIFDQYDVDALELPASRADTLEDRPGLYRKGAVVFADLTEQQHREATTCYYSAITEVDRQFGKLLDLLDRTGQADNTLVVLASDHGEALGAHGLYLKNVGAFEEIYNIPLIVSGPGLPEGVTSEARVGLHDLAPTLLELTGCDPLPHCDGRSFADALADPGGAAGALTTGYAEYFGTRYWLTQRVIWDGPWKLVWNGFDFDELYHLDDDPHEMTNLAGRPEHRETLSRMMALAWRTVRDTNDAALWGSQYPAVRLAPFGPGIAGKD